MIYTISAWWPNSTMNPVTAHSAHLADALDKALAFMHTGSHTTISVTTPESLELIRLWGQPPSPGREWP